MCTNGQCDWVGPTAELQIAKGKVICPRGDKGPFILSNPPECPVFSTKTKTANGPQFKRWVRYRSWRDRYDHEGVFVFTDGSSLGPYAAIVEEPGEEPVEYVRRPEPRPEKNVTAEMSGVGLGLYMAPFGSKVVVVTDFIGTAGWVTGRWKTRKPGVLIRTEVIAHLIEARQLEVTFVHHGGHQTDGTHFTRMNCRADRLCSGKALPRRGSN